MNSLLVESLITILSLTFLEIFLSADNAVVLGVLSNSLSPRLRQKALWIGVASAFVFRAIVLFLIAFILENTWIQLLGACYLIYLTIRYFSKSAKSIAPPKSHSFWKIVLYIELVDLVFAIDSIIAGIAFISDDRSKLWIVYVGGMIGLIFIRYAATIFGKLIERFPRLETSAYLMVGWVGVKLAFNSIAWKVPLLIFWGVTALIFSLGFLRKKR